MQRAGAILTPEFVGPHGDYVISDGVKSKMLHLCVLVLVLVLVLALVLAAAAAEAAAAATPEQQLWHMQAAVVAPLTIARSTAGHALPFPLPHLHCDQHQPHHRYHLGG